MLTLSIAVATVSVNMLHMLRCKLSVAVGTVNDNTLTLSIAVTMR